MAKIYVVTSGDYSDYRIDAVFSTKEKAEELLARKGHHRSDGGENYVRYGRYTIEEYDLDPDDTGILPKWNVTITTNVLTNEVSAHAWSMDYDLLRNGCVSPSRAPLISPAFRWTPELGGQLVGWQVGYVIEADTQEQAEKIAADWRREDIAMGKLAEWERENGINQPEND
jgi:hypothetical protein